MPFGFYCITVWGKGRRKAVNHGVERGPTSDAFLGGGENERCGNFKVSILSLINFSF